jgi:hypothetical protein
MMSKKLESAIKLAQVHYGVMSICGKDMETDVFRFIQENWNKGHQLFYILENEDYGSYIPYVMKNFTKKQIDQFFEELDSFFRFLMGNN